jgi:hypothetical protein
MDEEDARCFGKWSEPGVPHKDWRCVDIEDLGKPSGTCEMCETATIRYAHVMTHDDYPETLDCGCICAGNMEADLIGAKRRERDFKLLAQRRQRWLTRSWRTSWAGNEYLNTDGFNVVVFPRGKRWSSKVESRDDYRIRFAPETYDTSNEAKLGALEMILAMAKKRTA